MWTASGTASGLNANADGTVHEGSYVDGERHGEWVERFPDGDRLEEVVDDPSEQTRPVSEEPGPDTPGGDGPLHGSIAFSQDDDGAYAWGIAWSFDSSAGAQSEALGQCREYGGTRCAEAGWFREACGALAIGSGNGYGTGWGATTGEAERDALAQCRAVNDDCRIEVARCSQSQEAGGSGRKESEDAAGTQRPGPSSDSSCVMWEVEVHTAWPEGEHDVTFDGGASRAEAEERGRWWCREFSSDRDGSTVSPLSCVVTEPKCVQSGDDVTAGQSGPPGEAPDPDDAQPSDNSEMQCVAYVSITATDRYGNTLTDYVSGETRKDRRAAQEQAMAECQALVELNAQDGTYVSGYCGGDVRIQCSN